MNYNEFKDTFLVYNPNANPELIKRAFKNYKGGNIDAYCKAFQEGSNVKQKILSKLYDGAEITVFFTNGDDVYTVHKKEYGYAFQNNRTGGWLPSLEYLLIVANEVKIGNEYIIIR